ncbi:MAG: gamma carbonic anhydrase family protein [Clostridiales bacterium]|nr:gamma carbonic anhydrase family protein [Clostridiales bacterium]
MTVYKFEDKIPEISSTAYVQPSASIIGNVKIGAQCFIGPSAVIRADFGRIIINSGCAVEDNCVLHCEGDSLIIEDDVIVGQSSIVHGPCLIKGNVVIGMGSIISTGCEIGSYSFIGAGSVLLEGKNIPGGNLVAGYPAEFKKELDEKLLTYIKLSTEGYRLLSERYLKGLKVMMP